MKTVVTDISLWKIELTSAGKFDVILAAHGMKWSGVFTDAEMEQVRFRITEVTKGVIAFDPAANDLVNVHETDVKTLEEQASIIDELRADMKSADEEFEKLNTELESLRKHEKTIGELRTKVRDLEFKLLPVNNVQQTTEQVSTEQTDSVNNVQEPDEYLAEIAAIDAAREAAKQRQNEAAPE